MIWRAALLLLVVVFSHPARADEAACVRAHRDAQVERKSGKLVAAKKQLIACSAGTCPEMIASDCTGWLVEVERALPSVVIAVTDGAGSDARDVKVFVDGELVSEHLDGSALSIDPGEHRFRFQLAGAAPIERVVIVREGERARAINVTFPSKPRRDPKRPERESPAPEQRGLGLAPYLLGGLGVVALGGSGYFYYRGLGKKSDLDDSNCKPGCDQSEVDSGKRSILIADIALGVGVLALGSSIVWIVASPSERAVHVGSRF